MKTIRIFLIIFLICNICSITSCGTKSAEKPRKVVFIIVDGIPADVIERVFTPAIDEISARGGYSRAYMGGEVGGITQTPTVSADAYNSMLTSTWFNKHNISYNDISHPNYHYWTIFRIAKNQKKNYTTAVFSTWTDNRTVLVGEGKPETGNIKIDFALDELEGDEIETVDFPQEEHSLQIFKIDEKISEAAANCIMEKAPDIMWVYLWYTDAAGHEFGDSPEMDKYTELADNQVARIWEAVKYREEQHGEEWMIVVMTDHGRTASDGKGHGGHSERERTTWISTNVKTNNYFAQGLPAITDILPSISRFMDFSIPVDLQYEQEGAPFIGELSIANVKAEIKDHNIKITWDNYDNLPIDIFMTLTNHFKEGGKDEWKKVGVINANQKMFLFDASIQESELYKFSLRGKNNMLPVWAKIK